MKINISDDGARSLDKYSDSIKAAYKDISENTKMLAKTVDSCSDALGPIANDIIDTLAEINSAVDNVGEPVENISLMLKKSAEAIRDYIADRIK